MERLLGIGVPFFRSLGIIGPGTKPLTGFRGPGWGDAPAQPAAGGAVTQLGLLLRCTLPGKRTAAPESYREGFGRVPCLSENH
jgi:hypothetical protein